MHLYTPFLSFRRYEFRFTLHVPSLYRQGKRSKRIFPRSFCFARTRRCETAKRDNHSSPLPSPFISPFSSFVIDRLRKRMAMTVVVVISSSKRLPHRKVSYWSCKELFDLDVLKNERTRAGFIVGSLPFIGEGDNRYNSFTTFFLLFLSRLVLTEMNNFLFVGGI